MFRLNDAIMSEHIKRGDRTKLSYLNNFLINIITRLIIAIFVLMFFYAWRKDFFVDIDTTFVLSGVEF